MFKLLRKLSEMNAPTISQLSQTMKLDRSTLGRNLRIMERANLIKFAIGKDGRAKLVVMTHAGKSALELATPLWETVQKQLSTALDGDAEQLLAILAKINKTHGDASV